MASLGWRCIMHSSSKAAGLRHSCQFLGLDRYRLSRGFIIIPVHASRCRQGQGPAPPAAGEDGAGVIAK